MPKQLPPGAPDPKKYPALYRRWLKTVEGQRWSGVRRKPTRAEKRRRAHPRSGRHWSPEEDEKLRVLWGSANLASISEELERTQRSISSRAQHLKLGPANKIDGTMSLQEFSRWSGFSITKIKSTAETLGLRLSVGFNSEAGAVGSKNRGGGRYIRQRSRTYRIDTKQQQLMLDYMMKYPIDRKKKDRSVNATIRRMQVSDIETICKKSLAEGFVGMQGSRMAIEDHILSKAPCLVAVVGDRVVGYVVVSQWAKGEWWLMSLSVMKSFRRQGTAKKLMARLINEVTKRRANKLLLTVQAGNDPALKLYQSFGFEQVGVTPNAYDDGEDGIEMIKQIDLSL